MGLHKENPIHFCCDIQFLSKAKKVIDDECIMMHFNCFPRFKE